MSRWLTCMLICSSLGVLAPAPLRAQASIDATLLSAEDLIRVGKYGDANIMARLALAKAEAELGKDNNRLLKFLIILARTYEFQGRYIEAEKEYRRAIAIVEKGPVPDARQLGELTASLASLYRKQQRDVEADLLAGQSQAMARAASLQVLSAGRRLASESMRKLEAPSPQDQSQSKPKFRDGPVAIVPGVRTTASLLPSFPWPPPASSAAYVFPPKVFGPLPTIGDVTSSIISALERSGYVERSFFQTEPGGVALVTRLERIKGDGTPVAGSDRWPLGFEANPANLISFLRGLFFVAPGYYRVIVFILQDLPFSQSQQQVTGDEAKAWLREGANTLPGEIASRPFGNATCTALIYEFESDGKAAKMVESRVTGKDHLEKAGLLAVLEKAN